MTVVTGVTLVLPTTPLIPKVLAEPAQAILPVAPRPTRVRNGEYATGAPLTERDKPIEVMAKPIGAVEVGRPLCVLGLPEEQA